MSKIFFILSIFKWSQNIGFQSATGRLHLDMPIIVIPAVETESWTPETCQMRTIKSLFWAHSLKAHVNSLSPQA